MSESYAVTPSGPIDAVVRPPGSKSITNRALVCAALAQGTSVLRGALDSDDTRVMIEALRRLRLPIAEDRAARTVQIQGCGGLLPPGDAELFVGNSGTTIRFLTAMLALGQGTFRLHGTPRMHERPIGDLVEALAALGVRAECTSPGGCPPVVLHATGLPGGQVTVRGDVSSQFLSGLLLAAPAARAPLELQVAGQLVSQPYVTMTLAVMRSFGARVEAQGLSRFRVPRQTYRACDYAIEPDASAASYFFGAAAITGGRVTVPGLGRESLQGDVGFANVLAEMGCQVAIEEDSIRVVGGPLRGITVDMNAISDTVQTLGAVALFAQGPTTVTGVGHIRHKETDRLGALACELRKLGATVDERPDGLRIEPPPPGRLRPAAIDTYDDHRMAMSLALVGLALPGVLVNDPGCVAKTYPEFFADLEAISRLG